MKAHFSNVAGSDCYNWVRKGFVKPMFRKLGTHGKKKKKKKCFFLDY